MAVRIEFYGIPRRRAGLAVVEVEADCLGEALKALAGLLPEFAAACLEGNRLKAGYLANLNGRSFTNDPATLLQSGDCLLILSSDAGG